MKLRLATLADLPAITDLIPRSVRELSSKHYTKQQIESAIRYIFGADTQLIRDSTYFVVETADGSLAGCGGWSRRRTLCGGDQAKSCADELLSLDEPARIRAFFVEPRFARRGVATLLMASCLEAATLAGFREYTLGATLSGVAFYQRWGFTSDEQFDTALADGTVIAFVRMSRHVAHPPAAPLSRLS